MVDDKEAKRQDVIDAVGRAMEGDDSGECCAVPMKEWDRLVDAYRALNAPTPVRPEELEPGALFRFADDSTKTQWRLVRFVGIDGMGYTVPHWRAPVHPMSEVEELTFVIPVQDKPEEPQQSNVCTQCGSPHQDYGLLCPSCRKTLAEQSPNMKGSWP